MDTARQDPSVESETEVVAKAQRRRFTAEYNSGSYKRPIDVCDRARSGLS